MLNRLYNVLFSSADKPARKAERLPLATCVVLLEAARADDHFSDTERLHILDVMRAQFKLSNAEAEELIQEAHSASAESTDLWRFTHAINQGYSQQEKIAIMEEVWRLVLSDGELHGIEDHLAHKLRTLLNLNHPQMIEAKMKVLQEVRDGKGRG
ncbi:MAG: TerB family tellurite resistance protein [Candidatus Hydrogenedentes bacterium]|nr:TerB family tellurite resistance protein [Candidatus Hydrogenedentota bacterium]